MARVLILTFATVLLLSGCGGSGTTKRSAPSGPFRANAVSVRSLIEDELGSSGPSHQPRVRNVRCALGYCTIQYTPDVFVIHVEEDLTALNPVWKQLFTDPRFHGGTFRAWGETTSVGGKKSISPLFTLSCDRAAAKQIDWDNIDGDGIKKLCTWTPLVNFK